MCQAIQRHPYGVSSNVYTIIGCKPIIDQHNVTGPFRVPYVGWDVFAMHEQGPEVRGVFRPHILMGRIEIAYARVYTVE